MGGDSNNSSRVSRRGLTEKIVFYFLYSSKRRNKPCPMGRRHVNQRDGHEAEVRQDKATGLEQRKEGQWETRAGAQREPAPLRLCRPA